MRSAAKGPRPRRLLLGGEQEGGYGFYGGWWPDKPKDELLPWELGNNTASCVLGFDGEVNGTPGSSLTATSASPSTMFQWRAKDKMILQIGTGLYKTAAGLPAFGSLTLIATFTTSATCGMCEFNGKLVVVHPIDGVFDYDDTTWTLRNATVKGTVIAAWQNKLWVTGVTNTVWWSNLGSSATWTTGTDFNNLRDVDDSKCTMLAVAPGEDIQGRAGLIVAKEGRGVHRIYDSTTGAQFVLDADANCVGSLAFAQLEGRVGFLGTRAFYVTDGSDVVRVSKPVDGRLNTINLATNAVAAVGTTNDRFRVAFPGSGASVNNNVYEFNPETGAWMPFARAQGVRCFATYDGSGATVGARYYGGSAQGVGVAWIGGTGSDAFNLDGATTFRSEFETAWPRLTPGYRSRVRALTISGRGTWKLDVLGDWEDSGNVPTQQAVTLGTAKIGRMVLRHAKVVEAVCLHARADNNVEPGTKWGVNAISVEFIPLALN